MLCAASSWDRKEILQNTFRRIKLKTASNEIKAKIFLIVTTQTEVRTEVNSKRFNS